MSPKTQLIFALVCFFVTIIAQKDRFPPVHRIDRNQRLHMVNYHHSRRPFPYRTPHPPRQPRFLYQNQPYLQEWPLNPSQRFFVPIQPVIVGNQNNLRAIPEVVAHIEALQTNPSSVSQEKYQVHELNDDDHAESQKESHDERYDKEKGAKHEDEWHKSSGEKGDKKYDSSHHNKKGEKGQHFAEEESGHFDEEKGSKKKQHDEADEHGEHHESKKGSNGGKAAEKKHHKKGSKTSGYHNVFHKDELKKDHTFYDTGDHKGNFHKYGSDHADHHKKAGQKKKGEKHSSGHDEKHKNKKGHSEKGHFEKDDMDYAKKKGHDKHHRDEQEYHKAKKSSGGEEFSKKSNWNGVLNYLTKVHQQEINHIL